MASGSAVCERCRLLRRTARTGKVGKIRCSTQSWPSIVVVVVFLQVRLASASVIDKDCPGGPLCVPHGQTYLQNPSQCNYSPKYAHMRSQWCQDNHIHYKVWADIFMILYEARVFRKAKHWGSYKMNFDFADTNTMFLLENLITVDLFASTVIALANKGDFRTDAKEVGAFPEAKWLTKRCIDVETFLAHFKSLKRIYDFDDAILHARTAVEQMANTDCYTTKAYLNCKYAGVDCAITNSGMGILPLVLVCCGCVCVLAIAVVVFVFFRKSQQSNQARASLMSPSHVQEMPSVEMPSVKPVPPPLERA